MANHVLASSYEQVTHNRLPQRSQRLPRNRTGAFIELHHGPQKVPHRSIPPLARPRGVPATSSSSSYSKSTGQKQVVQNIRARQEWKGGFYPQPVKKSRSKQLHEKIDHRPSPHLLHGLPDYRDLTRRSARNFVAASNNGVTHLEDLRSESMNSFSVQSTTETVYDDMSSIAGLEEVYKKIIKEEALTQLSNKDRRGRRKSENKQSPLLIRSFRNPQNPHPVVQYSDIRDSNSPNKNHYISHPPVPAPFFYNSRTLPKAADHGGSRVHLSRLSGTRSSDHILAAPGVGILTKSALGFTRQHSPPPGIEGQPPPALTSRGKLTDSDERLGMMGRFRVPSTTPATSTPDIQKALEDAGANDDPVILPEYTDDEHTDNNSVVQSTECIDDAQSSPCVPSGIMLSLETDEGVSKVIDLEEEEERNKRDVIEYHAVQRALQSTTEDEIAEEQIVDECKEVRQHQQDLLRYNRNQLNRTLKVLRTIDI
ncbi:hypothetical protein BSL78_01535 [Apostichopus japonicus]|uniref:Uncharacterized protein n=1 Tax=Stichopus japonicus TaxID=307972 RepID=A0A2G8LMU0_STIJA|nr:hypothetical protein BSL78_01535 [Apostichopus japonicus]